jgi:phospholipid/cholesterol/gamma-HCH transport system substrate-binding protein
MKKISNEIKVGVTALITILVFIWLYNYLKGKNLFTSKVQYYVVYDKVGGLAESSPVEVNGYQVGVVQSIRFLDATSGRLFVVLTVDKNFKLPVNTVAEITTATLIAGMKVQFIYGDGPGTYNYGDTIPGRLAESILTTIENELYPVKDKVVHLISAFDSVISSVNEIFNPEFKKNFAKTVAGFNGAVQSLEEVLVTKETELKATLDNINTFTGMLAENSEKINNVFSNIESITDTLASADIYESAVNLSKSLEKASVLLENLASGRGTAGQLMTNDSLYVNLTKSLMSLDLLLQDLKANPKKYVHFSVFGGKNVSQQ